MENTELIRYRRALKRKNYSAHTVKSYVNILDHFLRWAPVPLSEVTRKEVGVYVDHLLRKRRTPKTITCHLQTIRLFFDYLINEEGIPMVNPVTRISLRLPKPLPRHLKDDQVTRLLAVITDLRDRAMFMLMLRCGLRVQEVADLTVDAVEYQRRQIFVSKGKGGKDRVVYVSEDARSALVAYLAKRSSKGKRLFLVQKGPMKGQTAIRPRHPEEDRILCAKKQAERLLPSASPHHGHAASQRRCGPCYHPGPSGAWPDYHNPALLLGSEPQGPTRLLQGHGGGLAKDAGTRRG